MQNHTVDECLSLLNSNADRISRISSSSKLFGVIFVSEKEIQYSAIAFDMKNRAFSHTMIENNRQRFDSLGTDFCRSKTLYCEIHDGNIQIFQKRV